MATTVAAKKMMRRGVVLSDVPPAVSWFIDTAPVFLLWVCGVLQRVHVTKTQMPGNDCRAFVLPSTAFVGRFLFCCRCVCEGVCVGEGIPRMRPWYFLVVGRGCDFNGTL